MTAKSRRSNSSPPGLQDWLGRAVNGKERLLQADTPLTHKSCHHCLQTSKIFWICTGRSGGIKAKGRKTAHKEVLLNSKFPRLSFHQLSP